MGVERKMGPKLNFLWFIFGHWWLWLVIKSASGDKLRFRKHDIGGMRDRKNEKRERSEKGWKGGWKVRREVESVFFDDTWITHLIWL